MWTQTNVGFFSIVRKLGEVELTVRSRARGDLDALRDRYLPELGPTVSGEGTDYPFRARVPADALGRAMAQMVTDITYPNFKGAIASEMGPARAHVYGRVWEVLRDITEPARTGGGREADAFGGVVIDERGRVLLREVAGHYGGYVWTFAKGRARRGETPERAALREVREECGIEAEIVTPISGTFAGDTSTTLFFLMRPLIDHGTFDRRETARVRWASENEARELIAKTRSARGRERDLRVLEAARCAASAGMEPQS